LWGFEADRGGDPHGHVFKGEGDALTQGLNNDVKSPYLSLSLSTRVSCINALITGNGS